jgi:hypothetical protein
MHHCSASLPTAIDGWIKMSREREPKAVSTPYTLICVESSRTSQSSVNKSTRKLKPGNTGSPKSRVGSDRTSFSSP